jgi:two-component system response regulator NreC
MADATTQLKVLLVDDHALVRSGMRALLDTQADMRCVGEAEDGATAVKLAAELQPDVITLDLGLRYSSGLEWVQQLQAACGARILVLTMYDDPSFLRAGKSMGIHGYVLKASASGQLMQAIRAVHRGEFFVDPAMQSANDEVEARTRGTLDALSSRELQVLQLLAEGHTNQAAADRLSVSIKTIESYRARLKEKLGLATRADVLRFALEHGLIKPGSTPSQPQ